MLGCSTTASYNFPSRVVFIVFIYLFIYYYFFQLWSWHKWNARKDMPLAGTLLDFKYLEKLHWTPLNLNYYSFPSCPLLFDDGHLARRSNQPPYLGISASPHSSSPYPIILCVSFEAYKDDQNWSYDWSLCKILKEEHVCQLHQTSNDKLHYVVVKKTCDIS